MSVETYLYEWKLGNDGNVMYVYSAPHTYDEKDSKYRFDIYKTKSNTSGGDTRTDERIGYFSLDGEKFKQYADVIKQTNVGDIDALTKLSAFVPKTADDANARTTALDAVTNAAAAVKAPDTFAFTFTSTLKNYNEQFIRANDALRKLQKTDIYRNDSESYENAMNALNDAAISRKSQKYANANVKLK